MENVALTLLKLLNDNGYEAYVVGGAVRNRLLYLPIFDYDVATDATPEEIEKVFSAYRIVRTGEKHGTVGVVVDKQTYEITTFRTDGEYSDHRKPDSVTFVSSLKEDLLRRDFTVNAMAYAADEKIIDYFGGKEDLRNRIIRAVGDPYKRFSEDALRILRAVRFCAQYGFKIEDDTFKAMLERKHLLKNVSAERIYSELNKAVTGKYVSEAFYQSKEILFEIIPELRQTDGFNQHSLSHDHDVFNHTLIALKACKKRTPAVMWALLLHDIGKPECFYFGDDGYGHTTGHMEKSQEIAKPILDRLKFPSKLKNEVLTLILNHDREISQSEYDVIKYVRENGLNATIDLYYLKEADNFAHSSYGLKRFVASIKRLKYYLDDIVDNRKPIYLSDLNINGDDLISMNVSGKHVGVILENLLDEVTSGKLENERSVLLKRAEYLRKNL